MGFAVECFFEPSADKRVRDVWSRLDSCGANPPNRWPDSRPHITLAVYEKAEVDVLLNVVREFSERAKPLVLRFESVGFFPRSHGSVCFLSPVMTDELLSLQRSFVALSESKNQQTIPGTRPGHWVAHCTLARKVSSHNLQTVFDEAGKLIPLETRITALALVQFPATQILQVCAL